MPDDNLLKPSSDPVVEKAQQDPQFPWFLTGVTAPCCCQSTSVPLKLSGCSMDTYELATFNPR